MSRILASISTCFLASTVMAAEPTGDDYFNFFKQFDGRFAVKTAFDGKQRELDFRYTVLADKKCIICSMNGDPQGPSWVALQGYDPAAKKWKITTFRKGGNHNVGFYSADVASLKGRGPAILYLSSKEVMPDGRTFEWNGKWTITFRNDQSVTKISEQT